MNTAAISIWSRTNYAAKYWRHIRRMWNTNVVGKVVAVLETYFFWLLVAMYTLLCWICIAALGIVLVILGRVRFGIFFPIGR